MPDDGIRNLREDEDLTAQELSLEDLGEVAGGNGNCGEVCNSNCQTECST